MAFFKKDREEDADYRGYVATLPCMVFGCRNQAECAHQDQNLEKGWAIKTYDYFSNPLCRMHHDEEGRGAYTFWHTKLGEDSWLLMEYRKSHNAIRAMKWLIAKGETDKALRLLDWFR